MNHLMTTGQVAAELGVNRKTVQRMVARGDLTPAEVTPLGPLFDPDSLQPAAAQPEPAA